MRVSQSFYEIIKKPSSVLQGLNILFLIAVLFLSSSIQGQSLVRNGDFESHTEFADGFTPFYWGIEHLRHWSETGHGITTYCHLDLENRIDTFFKVSSCCGNTINPHSGKGMAKLLYLENCPYNGSPDTGCTGYLISNFTSPLNVGSVYEVSMWIYFPRGLGEDPAIFTNIGFYLSLRPEKVPTDNMLRTDYFFADTVSVGEWYELKQYVRALCPLKYITIGVFGNRVFPSIHRQIDNPAVYFVDDIRVIEVAEDNVPSSISPTPFCNYFERRKKEEEIAAADQVNVYFLANESILDPGDQRRLDSFYLSKEGNQGRAFVLSGFTDIEGTDNVRLSKDRVSSVKEYFSVTYNLADDMIICFAKGVDTLGDNTTESGKKVNRRVTIENSNITSLQALYRKGLKCIEENNIPEAARSFKAWIQAAPRELKMSVLHDPRLDLLHSLPVWSFLTAEVRKTYHVYGQPGNAYFLDSMYFVDQRYRTYIPFNLTGYIDRLDTFDFRKELNLGWDKIEVFDSINHLTAMKYMSKHGLPKISQVGRRQAKTLIYILLHNTDSALIEKYLPVLKTYCLEGEGEWVIYANMFDKLKLIQDLPQHYGTQYVYINPDQTQLSYYKLDNLDAVNARRRSIGLGPINDPEEITHIRRE